MPKSIATLVFKENVLELENKNYKFNIKKVYINFLNSNLMKISDDSSACLVACEGKGEWEKMKENDDSFI